MSEINTWPGWENVELLGEGSFGKVYKIRRQEYGVVNEAALKVIAIPGSQADLAAAREEGMDDASVTNYFKSFVEDLAAEFALMSALKGNSNIVSYEDHMVIPREEEVGWDILISMELLMPLQAAAAERPLTERDVARLGMDMCRALALCRSRGIIHRDIKPENIFLSRDGNYKLGDFGVARVAEKTVSAMSRKGTYSYMAPEVYRSERYGFGADIYSLGIVLYRYLNNNRLPFLPPYPAPIQYSHREDALARRMGGEEIPLPEKGGKALKRAVLKACSYRAEDRYGTAEDFLADLESALQAMDGEPEGDVAGGTPQDRAGGPDGKGFLADQDRLRGEEAGEDEFDRTMSAVALGQAAQIRPVDTGKKEPAAKDALRAIEVSEILPAEDSGETGSGFGITPNRKSGRASGGKSGGKSGKKTCKRKLAPLVALLGAAALVVVALVIKTGLGGGKPGGTDAQAREEEEAAMAQAMQEVLAMLETPTDPARLDSHRAAAEAFDGRLMGTWKRIGAEQNGDNRVNGLEHDMNILETGEFYLKDRGEWMRLMEEQGSLPSMAAKDGETDFVEAAQGVYDDGEQHVDGIYTLLPSITDLSVTYELTDYEPEEGEAIAAFYEKRKEDGLTIRIQGSYQDGPLTVKTIDTSVHFILYYFVERWLFPSLEGRWTDNNGYIWAFRIAREPTESFGVAGRFPITFAMKDSTGKVYEGKYFTESCDSETGANSLHITFQDGINVPKYTLVSYDGMTLELEGEDGSSLVLTRS